MTAVRLLILLLLAGCAGDATVVITNRRDEPVRDVTVTYPGGEYRIAELAPGAEDRRRIRPNAEAPLELSWDDSTGGQVAGQLPVVGGDHPRTVEISIRDGRVGTIVLHGARPWHREIGGLLLILVAGAGYTVLVRRRRRR